MYEQLQKVKERVQRFREILGTPINPMSALREMAPAVPYGYRYPCSRRSKSITVTKRSRHYPCKSLDWDSSDDSDDSEPCRKSPALKKLLKKAHTKRHVEQRKPPLFFPKRYGLDSSSSEEPVLRKRSHRYERPVPCKKWKVKLSKKAKREDSSDSLDSEDICAKVLRGKSPFRRATVKKVEYPRRKQRPILPWVDELSSSYDSSDSSSEEVVIRRKKAPCMKRLVQKYAYRVPSSSSSESETESDSDSDLSYESESSLDSCSSSYEDLSESSSVELSETSSVSESSSLSETSSVSTSSVLSLTESSPSCSESSSLSESSSVSVEVKKNKKHAKKPHFAKQAKQTKPAKKPKRKEVELLSSTSSSVTVESTTSEVSISESESSVESSSVHEVKKGKAKKRCPKCHCVLPSSSSSAWNETISSSKVSGSSQNKSEISFGEEEENLKDLQQRVNDLSDTSSSAEEEEVKAKLSTSGSSKSATSQLDDEEEGKHEVQLTSSAFEEEEAKHEVQLTSSDFDEEEAKKPAHAEEEQVESSSEEEENASGLKNEPVLEEETQTEPVLDSDSASAKETGNTGDVAISDHEEETTLEDDGNQPIVSSSDGRRQAEEEDVMLSTGEEEHASSSDVHLQGMDEEESRPVPASRSSDHEEEAQQNQTDSVNISSHDGSDAEQPEQVQPHAEEEEKLDRNEEEDDPIGKIDPKALLGLPEHTTSSEDLDALDKALENMPSE